MDAAADRRERRPSASGERDFRVGSVPDAGQAGTGLRDDPISIGLSASRAHSYPAKRGWRVTSAIRFNLREIQLLCSSNAAAALPSVYWEQGPRRWKF